MELEEAGNDLARLKGTSFNEFKRHNNQLESPYFDYLLLDHHLAQCGNHQCK